MHYVLDSLSWPAHEKEEMSMDNTMSLALSSDFLVKMTKVCDVSLEDFCPVFQHLAGTLLPYQLGITFNC
jgi:hypothetical protein